MGANHKDHQHQCFPNWGYDRVECYEINLGLQPEFFEGKNTGYNRTDWEVKYQCPSYAVRVSVSSAEILCNFFAR